MKSLNLIKPSLILLITLCFTIPGLRAQETHSPVLHDFTSVSVNSGIELIITQGNSESVKILARQNLFDEVLVEQVGTNVDVRWRTSKKIWRNRTAKVFITYKNLSSITAGSGSSLKTENTLKARELTASVSSGAIIQANVDCEELSLQTNSGASALFSGKTSKLKLEAGSGGIVNALDLTSNYANVSSDAGASVKINVTRELVAVTNSGASIQYKGDATLQDLSKSKKGMVKKIN